VIYVDGIQVFDISDSPGTALGVPAVGGYGQGGLLKILGIRIYATAT